MIITNFWISVLTLQIFCFNIKIIHFFWKVGDGMKVYEKVRAYLDANGIKQKAVAQKAGIPNGTFNAIMNGKRTLYADDLLAICLALNVSPELFIEVQSTSRESKT